MSDAGFSIQPVMTKYGSLYDLSINERMNLTLFIQNNQTWICDFLDFQ